MFTDFIREFAVMAGILFPAEDFGGLCGQIRGTVVIGCPYIAVISSSLEACLTDSVETQPVPELEGRFKGITAIPVICIHVVDPSLHHRIG